MAMIINPCQVIYYPNCLLYVYVTENKLRYEIQGNQEYDTYPNMGKDPEAFQLCVEGRNHCNRCRHSMWAIQ